MENKCPSFAHKWVTADNDVLYCGRCGMQKRKFDEEQATIIAPPNWWNKIFKKIV